jgi:PTS system mannose-specific IIA component
MKTIDEMIGLILVTHGNLGEESRKAMEHIVGVQEKIAVISIFPDDDIQAHRTKMESLIAQWQHCGVIILTDMFGGTPSNISISLIDDNKVEVLAGLNLPMLIKLAALRRVYDLKTCITQAKEAGRKYIAIATEFL